MLFSKRSDLVVAVVLSTLLISILLGSCKLDPKLEIEGIGTEIEDGSGQSKYSFPVYQLSDLNPSEIQNSIVAVMARELLIVIDPVLRDYKVYDLGTKAAEFVRVSPGGGKIVIVTEVSGATGNIQHRAVVWNLLTKRQEFDQIFYGEVRDLEWDITGDDFLIVGQANTEDTYYLYKGDVDRFRDVTSTYIDLPSGYWFKSYGIIDITTSYGTYGSLYAALITGPSFYTTNNYRYIISRYERSNRFSTDLRTSVDSYNTLLASRNDNYLMYLSGQNFYLIDPDRSANTQLPSSAIEYDFTSTRFCIDNDEENIYSVDKASLNIKKYNISSGNISTIPIIMDEVFSLNNFHFVK